MKLCDPTKHSKWLSPHSIDWYKHLGQEGKYNYSWNSTVIQPNGEDIFDEEVAQIIKDKKVLDVGCGHGEFTRNCSSFAKSIVGFDVTENFIKSGQEYKEPNLSFILGSTKDGFPFQKDEFDCAYIRKGPTSSYPLLKRVVKTGGEIIGVHPGDKSGKELPHLFPNLFEGMKGMPILDSIKHRIELSQFSETEIEEINSIEYLHSPIDVLNLRLFGQNPEVFTSVKKEIFTEIERIFEKHATEEGLAITFSRYIVRAIV